ncbi:MAG: LptA/OstA family protein [Rhizomicrobium sp.]
MKIALLAVAALVCSFGAADAQQATSQTQGTSTQTAAGRTNHASRANGAGQLGSHQCSGPYDIASDNFVGNFETKMGTYLGNVIVTQAGCKLRADKVIAEAVGGNDLNRLTATGNVVLDTASGTATGDNGVYDLGAKTVTLTGKKVVLVKGKNVMRGTLLVVNMETGLAHLTAKGMPGGRVHSSFVPKPSSNDAAAPKDAAPKATDNGDN